MQTLKKVDIFIHFAKSKILFFCQYLPITIWFPSSFEYWSPLILLQFIYFMFIEQCWYTNYISTIFGNISFIAWNCINWMNFSALTQSNWSESQWDSKHYWFFPLLYLQGDDEGKESVVLKICVCYVLSGNEPITPAVHF